MPTNRGTLQVRAYRNNRDQSEPLALFYWLHEKLEDVPVRVHDACMTSEVLGSLKCDCSEQLEYALRFVYDNGGAVLYLPQEGRGIGLANKIAAYALQEKGYDTIQANEELHLPVDAREYKVAAFILEDMGFESIQLLTNNPRKINKLEAENVVITNRLAVIIPPTEHSSGYLHVKMSQMGHMIK